jgi:hypothetical protein
MGRGRAKAKQTKVARELKYHSPEINLERLRADISGETGGSGKDVDSPHSVDSVESDDSDDDEFGYDDEDEDETGSSGRAWSR